MVYLYLTVSTLLIMPFTTVSAALKKNLNVQFIGQIFLKGLLFRFRFYTRFSSYPPEGSPCLACIEI